MREKKNYRKRKRDYLERSGGWGEIHVLENLARRLPLMEKKGWL